MADVDMTDAPSASTAPVKKAASKAKGAEGGDGKKRFEVKKVDSYQTMYWLSGELMNELVERSSSLGLGYCRRQLCNLQKSHHGSLYVF
jgi:hypothetical protein